MKEFHEFGLIRDIDRIVNSAREIPKPLLGIGDDCAVISCKGMLLFSKDLFIEGVHFKREYYLPEEIGYKSVIVNVSDIAAMGGEPRYLLFGFGIPDDISREYIHAILRGFRNASAEYGLFLIGGDISRNPGGISISVTIIGEAPYGYIKRSTAKSGDGLFLTGKSGASGAGLELLLSGKYEGILQNLHKKPRARVREAILLAKNTLATAMIDISDGLVADLFHILTDSGVGAEVYCDLIPVEDSIRDNRHLKKDPVEYALYGGEDYELIFTSPFYRKEGFRLYDDKNKCYYHYHYIGNITDEENTLYLVRGNSRRAVKPEGYRHF